MSPVPTAETSRRHSRLAFGAILLALLGMQALKPIPWGDSTGAVFGPISYACQGDWGMDEFPFLYESAGRGSALLDSNATSVLPMADGHRLGSPSGLGIKLASLPSLLWTRPWWSRTTETQAVRANLMAVQLWTVLAALVVAATLPPAWRAWGLLAFFFGSTLWPQTRQTMWGATPALVGLAWLGLEASDARRWRGGWAGLALGWAVLCRPAVLPLGGLLWARGAWRADRRQHLISVGVGAIFAVLLLLDNLAQTGSALRFPQAVWAMDVAERLGNARGSFGGRLLPGLAGLLLSPARGLLIYSPWVLVAGLGFWRARRRPAVIAALIGIAVTLLLNASYIDWWGAAGWGPRRLMELLPILVWGAALSAPRPGRGAWLALLLAFGVQQLGALRYDSRWEQEAGLEARQMELAAVEAALWSVGEGPIPDALGRPLQLGREPDLSLAPGRQLPAPMPTCEVLSGVDRWPPAP